MKKIILIILLFLCFFCNLFTQEFNESKRIQNGDLSLISENLSDLSLATCSNSELRFLRNMVYAKYGHIFKSKDLINFFSNFNWYKPTKKVLDTQLSESEKSLVKRITIFETRNETAPAIKFGNELIGIWHVSPIMPDTWLDRFVIEADDKMEFLVSYFEKNPEISEYIGSYRIIGNILCFYVNTLVKQGKSLELKDTLLFKFPITSITEVEFMNGELKRQMISIGSYDYFLVYGDPRRS